MTSCFALADRRQGARGSSGFWEEARLSSLRVQLSGSAFGGGFLGKGAFCVRNPTCVWEEAVECGDCSRRRRRSCFPSPDPRNLSLLTFILPFLLPKANRCSGRASTTSRNPALALLLERRSLLCKGLLPSRASAKSALQDGLGKRLVFLRSELRP